jgi:hypothetical protein
LIGSDRVSVVQIKQGKVRDQFRRSYRSPESVAIALEQLSAAVAASGESPMERCQQRRPQWGQQRRTAAPAFGRIAQYLDVDTLANCWRSRFITHGRLEVTSIAAGNANRQSFGTDRPPDEIAARRLTSAVWRALHNSRPHYALPLSTQKKPAAARVSAATCPAFRLAAAWWPFCCSLRACRLHR